MKPIISSHYLWGAHLRTLSTASILFPLFAALPLSGQVARGEEEEEKKKRNKMSE